MPQQPSHVVGLIEMDTPAAPGDLAPRPRPAGELSDRFRGGGRALSLLEPQVLRLRASSRQLRADLQQLCQELDAELARVRSS